MGAAFHLGMYLFLKYSNGALSSSGDRILSMLIGVLLGNTINQINYGAADGGYGEEAKSAPGGNDAYGQSYYAREGRHSGFNYAGECHHGQSNVGHVVQKTAHVAIAYLAPDKQHGQHANHIGGDDGQQYADDDGAVIHEPPP
jgi:hypothetical protein